MAGYIGTHGMAHALDTLLDAAREIQTLPDGEHYRFLLLGDGANITGGAPIRDGAA